MTSRPSRKNRLAVSRDPLAESDRARRTGLHPWDELRQLDEVAPIERQVDDLGSIDDGADCHVLGL
jgi:hypothetical protein